VPHFDQPDSTFLHYSDGSDNANDIAGKLPPSAPAERGEMYKLRLRDGIPRFVG
jgi:hypothetical protein